MARTWWPRWAARLTRWVPMPPEAPKTVMFMVRCSCSSKGRARPGAVWLAAVVCGRISCWVPGPRAGAGAALVGQFRCGNPVVAGGEVTGVRCRFAACVGGAQRDDGGGEQEDRAGQQGALVAAGERGGRRGAGGEQGAGARGGDGGEDRQPERGAELLGGGEQAGGEPCLVGGDAGVGGSGDGDQDGAQPDRHDDQAGQQVGEVGAVDGDAGQVVDPGGGDEGSGPAQRSPALV